MLHSQFEDVCDDNAHRLSALRAERDLQMADDAPCQINDGDELFESGYCSDLEFDDCSASLFSIDKSIDCFPLVGVFADEESSSDESMIFDLSLYMRDIITKCPDEFYNGREGNQVLETFHRQEGSCKINDLKCSASGFSSDVWQFMSSLPLAMDIDDCEKSDDSPYVYAKHKVAFVDEQLLSHDKECVFDIPDIIFHDLYDWDDVAIHRGSNGYEIESELDLREDKEGLSEMYDPCCGDVYDLDVSALRKDLVRATQVWSLSEPDTGDSDSDSYMSHKKRSIFYLRKSLLPVLHARKVVLP
ncbi:hypothetical protein GOP47_0029687 [Adiantum capillus-veneris]|nr:hypothetical protein GOP47_0029687 [Adiantum capillus-veneris]